MDTSQGILEAKLSQIVNEYIAIRTRIPIPSEDVDSELLNMNAIVAIDRSGSMSGGPIRDARGALISLVKKFQKADVPMVVYTFSSSFQCYDSDEIGHEGLLEQAENLKAGGGTQFGPVIAHMKELILKKSLSNVYCVWLSDGQDNKGLNTLIPIMDDFKVEVENSGASSAVHCIGFSFDHDATLLTKLSQSGTREGSFQYVPTGGRIPVAINNIFELAFQSSVYARFVARQGEVVKKVQLEEDENDKGYLIGNVFASEQDLGDCKMQVHKGGSVWIYDLAFSREDFLDLNQMVHLVTNFVSVRVQEQIEQSEGSSMERLKELKTVVDEMDQRLEELNQQLRQLRVLQRKQLEPFIHSARDLIMNFYQIIKERAGSQLSNIDLAQLNSLAHKTHLKRSLEKKIAKRAGENLIFVNESEKFISDYSQSLNETELMQKYQDSYTKFGECIISCNNWVESICQGDCLCFTLHVERPKGGIHDPLQFIIKKINTSVVTAESFISSALFQGKAGQIIEGGSRFVQDGEAQLASSLVPGLPDEIINGIFPVYISEEHWQIARLRLRPLLAWNITVDVLGFEFNQLHIFPYMIMVKAHQDIDSDFSRQQFETIKDTCLAIYRDNRQYMLPTLTQRVKNYIEDPMERLPEKISNNAIFLCQLYCAWQEGDLKDIQNLFPFIFEEEVRRSMKQQVQTQRFMIGLFGITPEKVIKQFNLDQIFQKVRDNPSAKIDFVAEDFQVEDRIQELSEYAIGVIDQLHRHMESNTRLHRSIRLFELFGINPYTSISDSGLRSNEQILALIIQSKFYNDSKEYKNALLNNTKINPFNDQESVNYVKNIYQQYVREAVMAQKNILIKEIMSSGGAKFSTQFAYVTDLDQAAEFVKGTLQGTDNFTKFFEKLLTPGITYPIEKLAMLISGQYNGKKLIFDRVRNQ